MTTSRRSSVAAAVCAIVLLSGCSGSVNSGPGPSLETSDSQTVAAEVVPGEGTFVGVDDADRSDVDSTAEVAALMLHSWDTLTDRTQTAAAIRTKPLMSDEWASNQIEPERNGAQGSWLEPGRHQAFSSPSIVPATGDVGRDVAEDKAIRIYDVSWIWIDRAGAEIKATGRQTVTLYLEKRDGRWAVVAHQLQVPPS